jgi:hypothetical protein
VKVHWLAYRMSQNGKPLRMPSARVPAIQPVAPPCELDMTCPHRGEVIELADTPGCNCGSRKTEVFRCPLHGECTLHRVQDSRGRSWRSCVTCIAAEENSRL